MLKTNEEMIELLKNRLLGTRKTEQQKKDNHEPLEELFQLDGEKLRKMYLAEEQTVELCMAAVNENGLALQYIENQTSEVCMAAVQ